MWTLNEVDRELSKSGMFNLFLAEMLNFTAKIAHQASAFTNFSHTVHRGSAALGVFALVTACVLGLSAFAISAPSQTIHMANSLDTGSPAPFELPQLSQQNPLNWLSDSKTLSLKNSNGMRSLNDPAQTSFQQPPPIQQAIVTPRLLPVMPPPPAIESTSLTIKSGETLMAVLVDAGVPRLDAYNAIQAMAKKLDPRRIKAGQNIRLSMRVKPEAGFVPVDARKPILASATSLSDELEFTPQLVGFEITTDVDRHLEISRKNNDSFAVEEIVTPLEERFLRARGVIQNSLFLTAQEINIPSSVIIELIRMYSYDVDFQREIRKGDSFEIYYSRFFNEEGKAVKDGQILYGNMILRGKDHAYYRFKTPDDQITDYYNAKGLSAKKFLMKTPVDGARISSGFGRRKHPILGYTKAHKGVDFAAPRGTPIMAAGNGIIERANRFSTFGNYVKIRHSNGYQTAYAHLKGFARGIRKGTRVKQGQIIGYIGTTGRSTGPHLHYEVLLNNRQVNPMTIRVPTGRKLQDGMFDAFNTWREELDAQRARLPLTPPLLASVEASETPSKATN